ncbi:MAG: TlpA family protein disulfide reductase [Xanthomonadales bacterium]|nr:TlpA family protein disulfide reductase [Xanthomonadales bacterium]
MGRKASLFVLAVLLGAGAAWLFLAQAPGSKKEGLSRPAASELIGEQRPDFSLGSTTGAILQASDFDGQLLLVNFWATWCKPCREEMPMLAEVQREFAPRGFQVLGIALDDVAQARDFLAELGIEYPNAVGTVDVMALSAAYGNRAGVLPYSVLVDRDGVIRWNLLGEIEEHELRELLAQWL